MEEDNKTYDLAYFKRYHSGSMSFAEQHSFEKKLLEDRFLSEAYEGFVALTNSKSEFQLPLNRLDKRLEDRIQEKEKLILPFWLSATAAVIAIAFGIIWLGYLQETDKNPAANLAVQVKPAWAPEPVKASTPEANSAVESVKKNNIRRQSSEHDKSRRLGTVQVDHAPVTDKPEMIAQAEQRMGSRSLTYVVPAAKTELKSDSENINTEMKIGGVVTDEKGLALPGAIISAPGKRYAASDQNGKFNISGKAGDSVQIASVGYKIKTQSLTNRETDSIKLDPDLNALSEVVVVGYGTNRKAVYTGGSGRPEPGGGWEAFRKYVASKTDSFFLKNPIEISFEVSEKGELSGFKSKYKNDLHDQAVQIIKNGPAWIPVQKNGKPSSGKVSLRLGDFR